MSYTAGQVVHLLPYLYESHLPSGIDNPQRADPDMPKGSADTSHKGTWMAMLADLRDVWRDVDLTQEERKYTLHYALLGGDLDSDGVEGYYNGSPVGKPARFIAKQEGRDVRTVWGRINSAAERMAHALNGTENDTDDWGDDDDE